MSKMKSREKLESFVEYCKAHPAERFWQALRNWSKYSCVYVSNKCASIITDEESMKEFIKSLHDTFYTE